VESAHAQAWAWSAGGMMRCRLGGRATTQPPGSEARPAHLMSEVLASGGVFFGSFNSRALTTKKPLYPGTRPRVVRPARIGEAAS